MAAHVHSRGKLINSPHVAVIFLQLPSPAKRPQCFDHSSKHGPHGGEGIMTLVDVMIANFSALLDSDSPFKAARAGHQAG